MTNEITRASPPSAKQKPDGSDDEETTFNRVKKIQNRTGVFRRTAFNCLQVMKPTRPMQKTSTFNLEDFQWNCIIRS
jgi:hypothetical protein